MRNAPCSCFIVPSKMLRRLAENASGSKRAHLLDSAMLSERLRGYRAARGLVMLANFSGEKRRTVYDCHHDRSTPPRGKLVRTEGAAAVNDENVNQAYDNAGITYDFYREVLGRNSIDGKGMRLDLFVHYGTRYNNAFWDGSVMTFGDGDKESFTGFTKAVDVVAHELTHGVTQFMSPGGLDYQDQSGALNESYSDALGSSAKQWALKQTVDQADWLIGDGIIAPALGKALRSLKDPGNEELTYSGDDQPATMDGYVEGGDVHTNSGIPNHAFYLAAMALKGNSWEKAAPIWYHSLKRLQPDATFADAAKATISTAGELFGAAEQNAVRNAWKQVKVL